MAALVWKIFEFFVPKVDPISKPIVPAVPVLPMDKPIVF